jgi:hypothetical protein
MDDVDEVWGVIPHLAELVFILGPQGHPCPLYMLQAITSDKGLWVWEWSGVLSSAERHELGNLSNFQSPYK